MIEVEQKWIERFYFDPVMAAHVIMGARLDTFQKARLRFFWFTPETIDSSGVGTGKTIVDFVYLNLRCILIPNHLAAIYFPNFQVGKDAFWNKYFPAFEEQSPIFRAQFAQANKREEEKANQRNPGAWIRSYKNGSKLFMPAPDFKGDSKNQASRDFNTVVIDDYLRAEDQGDGIDKQLVDRARAPSFNKNHPIWCNHIKFLGHAESPTHKGYERVKAAKAMIRDGSSRHSLISFCYLDWSPELARKYREDNLIASQKRKLPPDAFRRQYLGIWTIDGTNYYPAMAILLARCRGIVPQCARRSPGENFILGQDVAEPGSRHADFCAWVVFRIVELTGEQSAQATLERMGRYYHVAAVFAHQLRNRDAGQIAALTHSLDLKFGGFSLVVLDPGGGGRWVLPELRKERQFIHGVERKVAPMTTREDPLQVVRRPIVSFFGRGGGDFNSVVEEQWRTGEEGFIERSHQIYLDSWLGRHHLWPEEGSKRPPQQLATFSEEQRYAQHFLDVAAKQVEAIRLLRRRPQLEPVDIRLSIRKVPPRMIEKELRGKSGIFPACRPRHSSERQIAFVQMNHIHEVPDFVSAGQGEDFIDRRIGIVQTIAATIIPLHGKEPEHAVLRPLKLELPGLCRCDGPIKGGGAQQPCDIVTGFAKRLGIGLGAQRYALRDIVKEIEVLREPWTILGAMENRGPRKIALRAAVGGDASQDRDLNPA